ncbi:DUF6164 family protein [Litoribrevibacter euphylliae]|uniref:DUF6164 family protein n=1 Tax=Litoribrevibacter euphylliae TaxID=1834034 RepID=A0ABV7HDC6_9GAMM
MPVLLFKLNGVSDEEADDVRSLLDQHNIDFYETTAGRWGVSMPGIWLPDNSQYTEAAELLDNYQAKREERFAQDHQQLMNQSIASSLWANFWRKPVKFLLAIVAVVFVLGLTFYPFIDLFVNE